MLHSDPLSKTNGAMLGGMRFNPQLMRNGSNEANDMKTISFGHAWLKL